MPEAHVFSIPLTTRFRGIDVREGMLLRGDAGWGEFSPFLEYDADTARPWLAAAREAADDGWPEPVRAAVPVNVTVPACDPERAREIVLASNGCRTAKVKVAERGQLLAHDEARLEAVRDALGPDGLIRIDANAGWSVEQAVALLTQVGLQHSLSAYPAQLSGGMQQRLAIAQALIRRPRILLLDEPFGALDPGIRLDMHALITDLWRDHGLTILMVTHDIKEAFKLGTRVLAFDKRRHDPQSPHRYGSTAVYDFALTEKTRTAPPELAALVKPAA